jgi:hypothetical protein
VLWQLSDVDSTGRCATRTGAGSDEPASLPAAGSLDGLRLKDQRFVAIGDGTVRDAKQKGPQPLCRDPRRCFADRGFPALRPAWLQLSMSPSMGSGGVCYGDSGGPHFLGRGKAVLALTVTADTVCRATDTTWRLDTPWARACLDRFATLS